MLVALATALLLAAPTTPAAPRAPAPPPPPVPAPVASTGPSSGSRLSGEWPDKPSGAKVTLRSGRFTVDRALRKIADAAGWNLVASTGRAGDRLLVIDLRDVPVEDALAAVLEGSPFVATRRGSTVTVAPRSMAPVDAPADVPVMAGFESPSGKKVTASFTDAPVDKVLRQISDAAGWSIVLPPGLRGAVNASFRATPVEEALKAVLVQSGLRAVREGSIVSVARESAPRVVVRGEKRRLVFDGESIAVNDGSRDDSGQDAEDRAGDEKSEDNSEQDAEDRAGDEKLRDKVISGDVVVPPGEHMGDVVALRGNVRMGVGSSARQVTAVLGSVELEPGSKVEQEAVAVGGDVHVASGAHVGRDVVSVGGEVSIDPGGIVDGQEVSVSIPGIATLAGLAAPSRETREGFSIAFKVGQTIAQFLVFFLLGLLLLAVAPARLDRVTTSLTRSPFRDVMVGLLGTVAMPILTVLLIATVIGILLVPVQLIAILIGGVLGYSALALLIGRALPIRSEKAGNVLRLAAGTAIVVLISRIPFVGIMAMISAWLLVFGAVLRTRGGQAPNAPPVNSTIVPASGP